MAAATVSIRHGANEAVFSARLERFEVFFRASFVILVGLTAVVILDPGVHGHVVAPALDLAMDTVAAVVTGSLTLLAWARFHEQRSSIALYQAASFLVLAVAYIAAVILSLGQGADTARLADPSEPHVYVFALARAAAALLLVVGGTAMRRHWDLAHPGLVVLIPGLIVAGIALAGEGLGAIPGPLRLVQPDGDGSDLPVITSLGIVVQLLTAALFFWAAVVCRSMWRREGLVFDAWIALGLLIAGFAEIHWALYPSAHPGQVSSADLLWLAFFVTLLLGMQAGARATLSGLREANAELATLRDAAADNAALEERARLARELHDGLAQGLWLAKLKAGELGAVQDLPPEAHRLLVETEAAIDNGLTEARQAVLALRVASSSDDSFCDLMRRYVEDFEDRFGLRVEYACASDAAALPSRTQAEVLRIVQEALTNVRQHADATIVGVRLVIRENGLTLRIADNGRGFDPDGETPGRYGLLSMRERATIINGRLDIRSSRGDGTTVVLTAPIPPRSAAMVQGATA
jgi:signal transduction histidine kinase